MLKHIKTRIYLITILLLLLCFSGTVQSNEQFLIAQVNQGIVSQTTVRPGWLPVSIAFEFQGNSYTARMQINSKEYNRYSKQMATKPRPTNLDTRLKLAQKGSKIIAPLIVSLRAAAPNRDAETLAKFALAFVQSLPYKFDVLTTPYDDAWRAPLQTLVDREIDCEDSSILYSSILSGLGIENALILIPNHMFTAVTGNFSGAFLAYQGKKYYVAETTGLGWKIGEAPNNYKNSIAQILPISALKQSSTPATSHPFINEDNSLSKTTDSSKTLIFIILFMIIATSLFLGWKWLNENKSLSNTDDDKWDDDFYDDYH